MDCGFVTDRLVGYCPGPPRVVGAAEMELPADTPSWTNFRREQMLDILSVFHLDNEAVLRQSLGIYMSVYGSRVSRPGFRPSEYLSRVATAFSIFNTLVLNKMPRPLKYVCRACNLGDNVLPLLNIRKTLHLSEHDVVNLGWHEKELLDPEPVDYVELVTRHLRNINFLLSLKIESEIRKLGWRLYGHRPTVIAASLIHLVLADNRALDESQSAAICDLLDCSPKTVKKVLSRLLPACHNVFRLVCPAKAAPEQTEGRRHIYHRFRHLASRLPDSSGSPGGQSG